MATIGAIGANLPGVGVPAQSRGAGNPAYPSENRRQDRVLSPVAQAKQALLAAREALARTASAGTPLEQRFLALLKRGAEVEAVAAYRSAPPVLQAGGVEAFFPRFYRDAVKNAVAMGRLSQDHPAGQAALNDDMAETDLKAAYLAQAWEGVASAWNGMPDWGEFYHERFQHYKDQSATSGIDPYLAFVREILANPALSEKKMIEPARNFLIWGEVCKTPISPEQFPAVVEAVKRGADPMSFGAGPLIRPEILNFLNGSRQSMQNFAGVLAGSNIAMARVFNNSLAGR